MIRIHVQIIRKLYKRRSFHYKRCKKCFENRRKINKNVNNYFFVSSVHHLSFRIQNKAQVAQRKSIRFILQAEWASLRRMIINDHDHCINLWFYQNDDDYWSFYQNWIKKTVRFTIKTYFLTKIPLWSKSK